METAFQRVGIVGVGLIGGSLGLAIKERAPQVQVLGIGRDAARLKQACDMGAVDDFVIDSADALRRCDLVVLATPIEHILSTLESIGDRLSPGTVVTDAGSTKRRICCLAWDRLPASVEFIGGHPVAGRELTGVGNSLPGLFRNAAYILCPQPGAASENLVRLESLVGLTGARSVIMSPEDHDKAMARVSHLPQLLSTALADAANSWELQISGTGLRDMLRLAGSSYSVWSSILDSNADHIELALEEFISYLQEMQGALRDGKLSDTFDRARECCRKLRSAHQ